MEKRLEALVRGRVQMVMYRDFVTRHARRLGLLGYVKNNKDGSVMVIAEGEEEKLKLFLEKLKKGSMLARVDSVVEAWLPTSREHKDFRIIFYD